MGISLKGKRKVEVAGRQYLWRIKTSRNGVLQLEIINPEARRAVFVPLVFKESLEELGPEMARVADQGWLSVQSKREPGAKILSVTPVLVRSLIPHFEPRLLTA